MSELRFSFKFSRPDAEDPDNVEVTMASEILADGDDDQNIIVMMMMEESIRSVVNSGELMSRFPVLAPQATAIISRLITESSDA